MAKYKVSVDKEKCIGCGACASTCPAVFEMRDVKGQQKSTVKQKVTDKPCAKEAEENCPVQAITVK